MSTSYDVTGGQSLEAGERYYMRTRAFDGLSYGPWSRSKTVLVKVSSPPLAPTGLLVEGVSENPKVVTFAPLFSWVFHSSSAGQGAARIQVGATLGEWDAWDSGKLQTVGGIQYGQAGGVGGTTPLALQRGVTYYWRVKTWDDSVDGLAGPFSEASTFKLNRLPTVPELVGVSD